jgi:2-methylcitrate dehydratase PrpD
VEIATYKPALEVCNNADPQTPYAAKFSLQYAVAVALVRGRVTPHDFSHEALGDSTVRRLLPRIQVRDWTEATTAFPHQRHAKVTVRTTDGQVATKVALTRKGDPDNPLTDADLDEKFAGLAAPVIGSATADDLRAAIRRLPRGGDVKDIVRRASRRESREIGVH